MCASEQTGAFDRIGSIRRATNRPRRLPLRMPFSSRLLIALARVRLRVAGELIIIDRSHQFVGQIDVHCYPARMVPGGAL